MAANSRRPGDASTRLQRMYFVVAGIATLTTLMAFQLFRQVDAANSAIVKRNAEWSAVVKQTKVVRARILEIDVKTDDAVAALLGGSESFDTAKLQHSIAAARAGVSAARRVVTADRQAVTLLPLLDHVDGDLATISLDIQRIPELLQRKDGQGVRRAAANLLRAIDDMQGHLDFLGSTIHRSQMMEWGEQQTTAARVTRDEWIMALIVITLLVMAVFGYRIAREENAAGREREQYVTELQAGKSALRAAIAERERALERSEQQHGLLSQAERIAHIGSWRKNLATGEVTWSEELNRIFGVEPSVPITHEIYVSRIHPEDRPRAEAEMAAAIEEQKPFRIEHRIVRSDNSVRTLSAEATFENTAGGTVITVIAQDITDRRAIEKMKDEFISTVSHELRTPLTSIRGALGLLASGKMGALPEKGQRLLQIASNNTDRLVRLINDILDIERMQSGKVTLVKTSCNAAEVVNQAVETVRALAERETIAIEVEAEPVSVSADSDRLVQTLTNLLGNAVKFSPPGSTIRVTARRRDNDVVFSVADQGRGIPAGKLDTIFERFQQVDASDSREKGGSGLGLAICRNIVTQHGGEISVQSEVGQGSTFTFNIPGVELPASEDVPPPPGAPVIFVCDDDADTRTILCCYLRDRGYATRELATGQDLLAAARLERPDAILLDLFMPNMNGWETLARLKSDPVTAAIPVVIASVLSPEESGKAEVELSGWLKKPFDEQSLAAVLDGVFRSRHLMPRVMLVEDDPDLARVITASFERYGIETIHAADGRQAIEMTRTMNPDLVVLDLILPGIDGFGVVDWLKDHNVWRSIPMVVYSATELTPSQRERLRLGPTEFLTKGRITPDEFEKRVIALLDTLVSRKKEGAAPDVA